MANTAETIEKLATELTTVRLLSTLKELEQEGKTLKEAIHILEQKDKK